MIYLIYEVNCRFLSILLHKYLISIFFTSFIEEIIIWFYFLCLHAAKKVSFKISCSLSLLCWLQNLQVQWLFPSGGSLQANLKIFIFHRQITHQLHFFPTFTQLTSYIPHILLEINSFLLPIWSTFVYEASVLSLLWDQVMRCGKYLTAKAAHKRHLYGPILDAILRNCGSQTVKCWWYNPFTTTTAKLRNCNEQLLVTAHPRVTRQCICVTTLSRSYLEDKSNNRDSLSQPQLQF